MAPKAGPAAPSRRKTLATRKRSRDRVVSARGEGLVTGLSCFPSKIGDAEMRDGNNRARGAHSSARAKPLPSTAAASYALDGKPLCTDQPSRAIMSHRIAEFKSFRCDMRGRRPECNPYANPDWTCESGPDVREPRPALSSLAIQRLHPPPAGGLGRRHAAQIGRPRTRSAA